MNSSTDTPSAPDRPRLLVLRGDDLPPGHERIDAHPGLGEVVYATADELSAKLPGTDALLVWDLFTEALSDSWAKADSLRWVHAATTGVDNLMFPGLVDSDVVVTNSRGVFDEHIAEYVLGLVISFAKDFNRTWEYQNDRRWKHRETERVAGSRALVVGTGPIGRAIARKLQAVGVQVHGSGSRARDGDPDFGSVAESTLADRARDGGNTLRTEIPEADYVVVAAPLTEATRGLVATHQGEMFVTGAGGSADAMKLIAEGGLYRATFLYNPSMSASAIQLARLIALGAGMDDLVEPEVPSYIQLPATTVTQENVADVMDLGY